MTFARLSPVCNASGDKYTSYAGRGKKDEQGRIQCPVCGKLVKLVKRASDRHASHIPHHHDQRGVSKSNGSKFPAFPGRRIEGKATVVAHSPSLDAAKSAMTDEQLAVELAEANSEPGTSTWPYLSQSERLEWLKVAEKARRLLSKAGPQQAAPVPPQKPELRVGQIWRTRGGARWGGFIARIEAETTSREYPFLCVTDHYRWTVTEDGRYWNNGVNAPDDLIELISDVPQKGGEA